MALVDIPGIGLGFIEVAQQAEAEIAAQRAVQTEVGAFGGAFIFVLRGVHVGVPRTVPLVITFFGDDIDHAARGAVAVADRRRSTNDFNALNQLRWDPVGIAAGIALAAPAQADGVTAGDRFAINQDQGIFRAHAADINLAVIPALAAGGVAGQVNARHGADNFGDIASGGTFTNFLGGDRRYARRLQVLFGGSDHHRLFGGRFFTVEGLFRTQREGNPINSQIDQQGQRFDLVIHFTSCFPLPHAPGTPSHREGRRQKCGQ